MAHNQDLESMNDALDESAAHLETFVREFRQQAGSLQTLWRRTVDEMLLDLARWTESLQAGVEDGTALQGGLSSGYGLLGTLAAAASRPGSTPKVSLAHPSIPRPAGSLYPDALASLAGDTRGTQITVAEGAVQITAQTVDEATIARAADLLATRLAFEDRRVGRG